MKCTMMTLAIGSLLLPTLARGGEAKPMVFEMAELKATVPADWKLDPKKSEFRLATWLVPAPKDGAPVMVYVSMLGADAGKLFKENVKRWQSMFRLPEGKKNLDEITKISDFKVGDAKVTVVDIEGETMDFLPMRRVNVIFPTKDATYYLILHGAPAAVEKQATSFEKWVKSFK